MLQSSTNPEIAILKRQTSKSIEMGDLSAAYCTSKLILKIVENENPHCEDLPDHLYELGLICTALDNFPEGVRHLKRAIECCQNRNRKEDAWLLKESLLILSELDPE